MEELKTTKALEMEIIDDARKKAQEILKTADDTLAAQKLEWEEKLRTDLDSARKNCLDRMKSAKEEIFAKLPLDKRRLRSETAESFLVKAMDDFLCSLEREKLLSILKGELTDRFTAEIDSNVMRNAKIIYSGMDLREAAGLLKKVTNAEFQDADFTVDAHNHKFPFIEINAESIKITVSVENAAADLLKDKRAELASALLGEGVLYD